MPGLGDSFEWDFLTLAAWWNLYGLPVLLTASAVVTVVLARRNPLVAPTGGLGRLQTVRRIGLIHYGLALRALIQLVQELLALRVMGIPQSFPVVGLIAPAAVLVNALLGLALRRRRPRGWLWAFAWYALLSLIAISVTVWMWRYNAAVDAADWPDHLVSKGMPLYLLVVMLLPRTRCVFAAQSPAQEKSTEPRDPERGPASAPTPAGPPVVSLLTLMFLIIVTSTLVVDVADWVIRLATEPGEVS
jgi:hypothetical protein